ncbi:Zn-dependent exopeptidase [Auricularia subglabra TFB-10046 SS5]|uniref:Peptide hydrolase n=1 Tax=Auricularia subglabra (strain TFB-10046 / SS5) TaxID=717982 RepID=J0LH13_AURST|nr:Zn-dependent exopeptidase [Auricularia subglabra TFB-10046 SS5]
MPVLLAVVLLLGLSCTLAQHPQTVLAALPLDGLRLVRLDPTAPPQWLSRNERREIKASGVFFKDITDRQDFEFKAALDRRSALSPFPTPNSTIVHRIISYIDSSHAEGHINHLTSLWTRWCESDTGREASDYLYEVLRSYVDLAPEVSGRDIHLLKVEHAFKQYSLVLRIASQTAQDDGTHKVAIVGAHLDSASRFGDFERAPGADDDASGTATVLEAARLLLRSGYVPARGRAVEMHLNAGEEAGLLGSQDIAQRWYEKGVRVRGMLQLDMTAWVADKENEHIGITMSRDRELGEFNKRLVDRYLDIPWIEEYTYPYYASDSASWGDMGYPCSDALEGTWAETRGHRVHTEDDNTEHKEYSFRHMMQFVVSFVKLAVAFLVELGGEAA